MAKRKVLRSLILTESAGKARSLKKLVGRQYNVMSTDGFLKDLPKSRIGIDPENNFEPDYITVRGKGELLQELKSESLNARRVFLATNPDAKGEFLARQYCRIFGVNEKSRCRMYFDEMTKTAVRDALENARPVDENLADAYQAGQIVDKLASHRIGEYLECKIYRGVKVGRFRALLLNLAKTSAGGLKNPVEISGGKLTLAKLQELAACKLQFSAGRTRIIAEQLFEGFAFEGSNCAGLIKFPGNEISLTSEELAPASVAEVILPNQLKLYELIYNALTEENFSEVVAPSGFCDEFALMANLDGLQIDWADRYAAGLAGLVRRNYVVAKDSALSVTETGERVLQALKGHFGDLLSVDAYKKFSSDVADVAAGKLEKQAAIENYCKPFEVEFKKVMDELGDDAKPQDVPAIETDEVCEKCGRKMLLRRGRYGNFLACSGYPECKNSKPYLEYTDMKCPKCGGRLAKKKMKFGRTFYRCEKFPECDFSTWDEPQTVPCKTCGATRFAHKFKDRPSMLYCGNENCPTRENHPVNKILADAKQRYEHRRELKENRKARRAAKAQTDSKKRSTKKATAK